MYLFCISMIQEVHCIPSWSLLPIQTVFVRTFTTVQSEKGQETKFHSANPFDAFFSYNQFHQISTLRLASSGNTFFTLYVSELVFLKTVNFSLTPFLWIWIFLIPQSHTPTESVFSLFSDNPIESWFIAKAEGSTKCFILICCHSEVFIVNVQDASSTTGKTKWEEQITEYKWHQELDTVAPL